MSKTKRLIKKYLSKKDKELQRVNPKYILENRKFSLKQLWKETYRQKVIETLPKRLANEFDEYEFHTIKNQSLTSIFISGEVGVGKTVLSAYYYVDFIRQMYLDVGRISSLSFHFVIYPNLIDALQKDYKDSENLIQKYSTCDLLVLDEFGARKVTEYVYDLIYLLLNERYLNKRITIINSNDSLESIGKKFSDERIVRRIDSDYLLIIKK